MPTKNIVLTDHQNEFVNQMVNQGHYQNASELLRDGLRLVEKNYNEHQALLKEAISDGLNSGISSSSVEMIIKNIKASIT